MIDSTEPVPLMARYWGALAASALARVSFAVPENLESRRARLSGLFARALKDAQESRLLKGDAPMAPLLESLVDDPKR